MPQFAAITRERHAGKRWRRFENYGFASTAAVVPIVGTELARALLAMPLAFIEVSGRYTLVAVLSLMAGRNMFLAPDGRWLGAYAPAWFRAYPFRLVPKPGTDEVVLCVDEDSGFVVEDKTAGEEFFDKDGNASPALKTVVEFLTAVERSRKVTDLAVAALAQAGVIKPWSIKIKSEQGEKAISGLHHVDEAALSGLPDDAFLKLRKASALTLADAQLLSMGNLGIFERLAKLHSQPAPPPVAALPESLDSLLERLNDDAVRFR